ncbi:hypothetical protein OF001_U70086 [Pseudomonas sp. OF001]|nr:hypothetical protein OF001_U70086 [Pseudomonas sp. OF001]
MGGTAGQARQLGVAQAIQFGDAAVGQQVEERLVPFGVERVQRLRVVDEAARRIDHPLLARRALVGRQVAAAAHQAFGHARVHLGQLGHRRLVRQAAGGQQQHALVQRTGEVADGLAEQAGALEARQRRGDRVDEHRDHRATVETTEQQLQRLGESVVDLHAVGHRGVHPGLQHRGRAGLGQFARYGERAGCRAVVADGVGGHADAERRHQVVEEAVVVVRREQDDQLGSEARDALAGALHHGIHLGQHLCSRIDMAHQRRVRQALQVDAHPSLLPAATTGWDGTGLRGGIASIMDQDSVAGSGNASVATARTGGTPEALRLQWSDYAKRPDAQRSAESRRYPGSAGLCVGAAG